MGTRMKGMKMLGAEVFAQAASRGVGRLRLQIMLMEDALAPLRCSRAAKWWLFCRPQQTAILGGCLVCLYITQV